MSPDGVFTGVAMFGRAMDVMSDGGGGGGGGEGGGGGGGSLGLLDWVNSQRGTMGGGGGGGVDITLD